MFIFKNDATGGWEVHVTRDELAAAIVAELDGGYLEFDSLLNFKSFRSDNGGNANHAIRDAITKLKSKARDRLSALEKP